MRTFTTQIPVDLKAIAEVLPKDALVESIQLKTKTKLNPGTPLLDVEYFVEVSWQTGLIDSPTWVALYPLELLRAKRLPQGCTDATLPKPAPAPKVSLQAQPEPPKGIAARYLTKQEVLDGKRDGVAMEFQGLIPVWQEVTLDHQYVAGYYYRKTVRKEAVDATLAIA